MAAGQIETAIDYYADPAVSHALLSCWGCRLADCSHVSLLDPEMAGCLETCTAQYLTVSSTRIAARKRGGVPVRAIPKWMLPGQFQKELQAGDGALEISQPLGYYRPPAELAEKPMSKRLPERTLFFLDFEAYNESDATWTFKYPRQAFEELEGTYHTLAEYFAEKEIDALIAMSGRGYHVVSQIPYTAPAMEKLLALGHSLSPEVLHFLNHPRPQSKRTEPIPWNTERAYWGARQLEHFVYTQTIGLTRQRTNVPVEMSDRGKYGISFDPTSMNRTTETGGFGTPLSIYAKPHVRYHFGGRFPTRSIRALVLDGEVQEFGDLDRMIRARPEHGVPKSS